MYQHKKLNLPFRILCRNILDIPRALALLHRVPRIVVQRRAQQSLQRLHINRLAFKEIDRARLLGMQTWGVSNIMDRRNQLDAAWRTLDSFACRAVVGSKRTQTA